MELIVAVYDDWGIGANGTQPIALKADRAFFRETTRGATVIVGRRTAEDFPGRKPLPGRKNILLTRKAAQMPGFTLCESPEAACALTNGERVMVIGGGSVYRQMLPLCDLAYVTKVHCRPQSDTYFPNLDADDLWEMTEVLRCGEEDGIAYEMCLYQRKERCRQQLF